MLTSNVFSQLIIIIFIKFIVTRKEKRIVAKQFAGQGIVSQLCTKICLNSINISAKWKRNAVEDSI